eukprot:CAMPEP_0201528790 /NCGR_PEP_ID=MMETSP0161_2-20130828/39583_1 /ASSEMBLY_ACC=CAM_ASM_000251 /TAXON_ID=180227 /ORGANISM="Neoparamoeba aestuarina, Strain SoJaBio B1-5/56/2" /LENGTH=98 /DNA_ID=CAMNT_0047930257 /DNA_START=355 /DNA_END=647 /DNA_ORIENTATION=+
MSLTVNRFYGSLDLTTLPSQLETAYLWGNRFTDPITLTSLPTTLRNLEIHGNRIRQQVVWYDNLPKNITIQLERKGDGKFGKVCAVNPDEMADPKVFA